VCCGRRRGSTQAISTTTAHIAAEEIRYIARQPNSPATSVESGRASRMPNNSPLITVPTV
jgi:hypothetical protein